MSVSYLKGTQILSKQPTFTKIPLHNGFWTSSHTLIRQKSPISFALSNPSNVAPIACIKYFLSHFDEQGLIFTQKGDLTKWILFLSTELAKRSNKTKCQRKTQGHHSKINSKSSSQSKDMRNKFWPASLISNFFFVFHIL